MEIRNFTKESVIALINKDESEINLENNYYFKKKLHPENFKMINDVMFDWLIKPQDKNAHLILIKNIDNKYNLDTVEKIERLAHVNKITKTGINFYHMENTQENLAHIVNRYGDKYRNLTDMNYPQLLLIRQDKIYFIPQKLFLRQKGHSDEELNKEINNYLI